MKRAGIGAIAVALWVPTMAQAWWNADWQYRQKIALNPALAGMPARRGQARVPVLIRLHAGNFDFPDTQQNGADLAFVAADDRTPLPFQIEKYDALNDVGYVWVRLPDAVAEDTAPPFWLYYGNPAARPPVNPRPVWDTSQSLVFHFAETETLPLDASGHGNNATHSTMEAVAEGQVDVAARYDGKTLTLVPASPTLRLSSHGGFSFSAWIKPERRQSAILFQQQDGARSLTIALRDNQPFARLIGAGGKTIATLAKARLAPARWQFLAVTASDRLAVFIDGVMVAATAAALPDLAGTLAIGGTVLRGAVVPGTGFKGLLDELRLSNQAHGADWFNFEMLADAPDSNLLLFDGKAQQHGRSDDLAIISLLAGALNPDGRAFIGLIVLLGLLWAIRGRAYRLRRARIRRSASRPCLDAVLPRTSSGKGNRLTPLPAPYTTAAAPPAITPPTAFRRRPPSSPRR